MKTKYILLSILLALFIFKTNAQITINGSTGNLAIGDVTDPSIFKIFAKNGNASMLGCTSDGYGDHLFRIFSNATFLSFSVNSFNLPSSLLVTRIGINYDINGSDGTTEYARIGSKHAPAIELNAEEGSISLFGESGTGSDFRTATLNQGVYVNSSGCVSIAGKSTGSNNKLYVYGNTYIGGQATCQLGMWSGSDSRLKKNIKSLEKSKVDSLFYLNAKSYQFKAPTVTINKATNDSGSSKKSVPNINITDYERVQFGYIAEDMEKIYPNLVKSDSDGFKSVNYTALIPIIIEALKKQQFQIDSLKQANKKISLKSATNMIATTNIETLKLASLGQNAPNPFSQSTNIGYYLPESVGNATIYVYDMNGVQIKSYPIASKGNGSITINGYELKPGMYLYALIADGQEIATKRMILTSK